MYEIKVRAIHDTRGLFSLGEFTDKPCPAILTCPSHYLIEFYRSEKMTRPEKKCSDKPAYKVPTMEEVKAIPWNGFNAISTFSGCGGSSLGYRMAGFRILWANEFVEAAQDSYNANKAVHTTLDSRDIRNIEADEILNVIGMEAGELDLLDGSPPCAAFSTAGKREKTWGKVKKYSDKSQRVDDLFFEFARLLKGLRPKTFVAENVSGLVKGTAKGYFKLILHDLKACGYKVSARVLDAAWLGVPQSRQRLIFVGVREDLKTEPAHPKPLTHQYTVRDALPMVEEIHGVGGFAKGKEHKVDAPAPTIMADGLGGSARHQTLVKGADISPYAIGREWDRLKPGEQSEKYLNLVKADPRRPSPTICQSHGNASTAGVTHPTEKRKFTIDELKLICSFPDDFILTGTYAQQWERLGRAVPPVMMFHIASTVRDKILMEL